jgi:hypothetical protein
MPFAIKRMRRQAVLVGSRKCGPVSNSVFRNNLFRKTETRASVKFVMITSTDSPRVTRPPKAARPRRAYLRAVFATHPPEAAKKGKNGRGGRRNPLKRLDSEKKNQEFSLDCLWPGLAALGQIWENLGLAWKNQTGVEPRPTPGMRAMTCGSVASQGRGATGLGVVPTVHANIGFDRLWSRKGGRTTEFQSAAASEQDRDEIRS